MAVSEVTSRGYVHRLFVALLTVLASFPLSILMAMIASSAIHRMVFTSGSSPALTQVLLNPPAIFTLCSLLFVAVFMFLLTLAGRFMPFIIALSIPMAYLLVGYPISFGQWAIIGAAAVAFILLVRLINRNATPLLAIFTVLLAFGVYLVPALQSIFTAPATATAGWLVNILICWVLWSVAFGLIENAILASREYNKI